MKGVKSGESVSMMTPKCLPNGSQNAFPLDCSRHACCCLAPGIQETNQNTWFFLLLNLGKSNNSEVTSKDYGTLTENPEVQAAQLESLHRALLPECITLGSGLSKSHWRLCETQLWSSWSKYRFILWETSASLPHTLSSSRAMGMLCRIPFVQRRVVLKLRDHILII